MLNGIHIYTNKIEMSVWDVKINVFQVLINISGYQNLKKLFFIFGLTVVLFVLGQSLFCLDFFTFILKTKYLSYFIILILIY